MLEVAFLAAHVLGFLSGADQLRLLDLVTERAARVLGIEGHGIAVGSRADLCVHHHERVVDVLREHARPRWVLRAGRVVAESEEHSQIHR
jgi:cytosine deaminase